MNILDYLQAYGTSEGAQKGWENRDRGDKAADKHLGKAIAVAKSAGFKTDLNRLLQIQRAGSGQKGYSHDHMEELRDMGMKHNEHSQRMAKGTSMRLMDKGAQAHSELSDHLLNASESLYSKSERQ